jgi:hypothetical protein
LQRIKQRVVEAEAIDILPALRGEVKMPIAVRSRSAEHRDTILGAVRDDHVWDWSTRRAEHDALNSLSKLRLFDYHQFSNRFGRSNEQCAHERDYYHPIHGTIISHRSS